MKDYTRVTIMLTITSFGEKLKPIVIFKAAPKGKIFRFISQYKKDEIICVV